ncbi:uncharacterized protein (DUF1778 family) [Knoellia remsis]|uniref:Uncharacterized protein (DUF1778 family) n=1 Tax=Knoellia remsis TaxID=407159 RepID=A0A2T0U2U6_9MICO|nr:DUF1778 domain-containing protein [Knoellia remsis]PRY52241.1 uncharacterized protein (DUF1778 family) [Knoellia remsis]
MSMKSERLNVRCSADSLALLREAAELQGQDMTSFVMGAALDRARAVLSEDRGLRLTPDEVLQVERALAADAKASPQLVNLIRSVRSAQNARA